MEYPEPNGTRGTAYCLTTYALFALTGWLALAVVAPEPLANLGVIEAASLRGWSTLTSIVFGPPATLAALVASVLSLGGLALGPWPLRLRIAAWWLAGAGGAALSALTAPSSRFSPYLGGPLPPLGISDAILVIALGICVLLPSLWIVSLGVPKRAGWRAPAYSAGSVSW